MSVIGAIGDFDIAGMLGLLEARQATGQLQVIGESDMASLYLERGHLRSVSSMRPPWRLGTMLLRADLLTWEDLTELLDTQTTQRSDDALGALLIADGRLTEETLAARVEEQSVAILCRLFRTRQGTFIWASGVTPPRQLVPVALNAKRIILDAMRRSDEYESYGDVLPAPTMPIRLTKAVLTTDDSAPLAGFTLFSDLSEPSRQVLTSLFRSSTSLFDLEDAIMHDQVTVFHAVIDLHDRGMIATSKPAAPREQPRREEGSATIVPLFPDQPLAPFDPLASENATAYPSD